MDDLIPIKDVPALVPGNPCLRTVRIWYSRGVRGRKLPTVLRGGRIFVSRAAVAEFLRPSSGL